MKNKILYPFEKNIHRNIFCLLCCISLITIIGACTPAHRFTRLRKVPREYRMNYCDGETKSPRRFYWDGDPWVVFSDSPDGCTFTRPGGKIVMRRTAFMEPFLVIGRKGNYLRLLKYEKEIVKGRKLTDRKKAEYCGWISLSNVLSVRNSETDLASGRNNKFVTVISDTLVLNNSAYYLSDASLVTFSGKNLQISHGKIPFREIVYKLKGSPDGRKSLISRTHYLSLDSARYEVLGWVSNSLLAKVGQQHYMDLPDSPAVLSSFRKKGSRDTLRLSDNLLDEYQAPRSSSNALRRQPVTAFSRNDSAVFYRSALFAPAIDYRDNYVFNVNGDPISYSGFKKIEKDLSKINLTFVFEGGREVISGYPKIVNAVQNLQSRLEPDSGKFTYTFSGVLGFGTAEERMSVISPMPDFMTFMDSLSAQVPRVHELQPFSSGRSWPALRRSLDLFKEKEKETNLIILIGETGYQSEWADSLLTRRIAAHNCRILGFQLYGGDPNTYNNFVLQVENMIDHYARIISTRKREILVTTDQLTNHTLYKENSRNMYSLDFPTASMTQGWVIFPAKKQPAALNELVSGVDTLLSQVQNDNTEVIRHLREAFNAAGNYRSRYDSTLVSYYNLPASPVFSREFADRFTHEQPLWYLPTGTITVPDSLQYRLSHYLLLNESEFAALRSFMKELSSFQMDYKYRKENSSRGKKKCNCPDDEWIFQELSGQDTVQVRPQYIRSRRLRKRLVRFYLHEANRNKVCKIPRRKLKKQSIARLHERILTLPTGNSVLNDFALKDLKKKKVIDNETLDRLLIYFKSLSDDMENNFHLIPRFTNNGQTYYWIDGKMLP